MDYFYTPPENITGNSLTLKTDEFVHLTHVMRKERGDIIRVVDGLGTAYDVELGEMTNRVAAGTILATYLNHNEPGIGLTLGVALLKNPSRFDFLVEKVSELGVREIIPLYTERTIPSHAKVDRWKKLALAGMKQSGRSYLPRIRDGVEMNELLRDIKRFDICFAAHENPAGAVPIRESASRPASSVLVIIGPEGGFSEKELEICRGAGFKQVYFGPRRLRAETAAIVAAASLLIL